MKTILVTGGAGFVGSHACKAIMRAGYTPVSFDNLERGHHRAVKWGPLEQVICGTKRICGAPSRPGARRPSCTLRLMPMSVN